MRFAADIIFSEDFHFRTKFRYSFVCFQSIAQKRFQIGVPQIGE